MHYNVTITQTCQGICFLWKSVAVVKFVQRLTVRLRLGGKRSFKEEVKTGLDMVSQVKLLLLQLIKKMGRSAISRTGKRLHFPQWIDVGNKCRRYITLTKIQGKPLQDYIKPAMDFWAKERTLAGKIPM